MKILHITQGINPEQGGLTTALQHILALEKHMGYSSDILTIDGNNPKESLISLSNQVFMFPRSFPGRFYRSSEALAWLKKNVSSYDLVQLHSTWNFLVQEAAAVIRESNVPYTLWPHGSLDYFDLQKKKLLKKIIGPVIIKQSLQGAVGIIYTVPKEAEESENYEAVIRKRILPLPVSVKVHVPKEEELNNFRTKFGIKPDDRVLLFLSRIDYKKGLDLLIPALAELVPLYPHLKLLIAGSDSNGYLSKVKAWIRKFKLEKNVILPGFLSGKEKACAFHSAQCFVLPSKNENFGIAVVEALAHNLPVLISDQVYIYENIERNKAGWVCKHEQESVKGFIEHILKNPDDVNIRKEGCIKAYQNYDPLCLSEIYEKAYQEMAMNNKKEENNAGERQYLPAT